MSDSPGTMQKVPEIPVIRKEEEEVIKVFSDSVEEVECDTVKRTQQVKVPHHVYQTTVIEKKPDPVTEVVEIPKIVKKQEVVWLPPEHQYKEVEVPIEKKITHIHEKVVYSEKVVEEEEVVYKDQIVDKPVPVEIPGWVPQLCYRRTQYEITVPAIVPVYEEHVVPIYVPEIVESPWLEDDSTQQPSVFQPNSIFFGADRKSVV